MSRQPGNVNHNKPVTKFSVFFSAVIAVYYEALHDKKFVYMRIYSGAGRKRSYKFCRLDFFMDTMKRDMETWLHELKKYAVNCRKLRPIPRRNFLSRPQIFQMIIIKGSLLSWINYLNSATQPGPAELNGHNACFVFTSTCPGLVAAQEIMQGINLPLVALFPEELRLFFQSFPDNESRYHAHIWSHFLEELDSATKKIAEQYPLSEKERYWLHVEGIMRGPKFGRGIEHLWSWNGSQTKLLKKSFMHWAT